MSVGVRSAASGPIISRSSASTTKVYGRLRAMRTSAVIQRAILAQAKRRAEPARPEVDWLALIYPNWPSIAKRQHAAGLHFLDTHPRSRLPPSGPLTR